MVTLRRAVSMEWWVPKPNWSAFTSDQRNLLETGSISSSYHLIIKLRGKRKERNGTIAGRSGIKRVFF